MPLTSAEWDSGKVYPLENRIMDFLNEKENVNGASIREIIQGLENKINVNTPYSKISFLVKKALDNLINDKSVEAKEIEGISGKETYYKVVKSVHI